MKTKIFMFFTILLSVLHFCIFCIPDLQADDNVNIFNPSSMAKESIQAWQSFNTANHNRWNVEWNKNTGTPHQISGYYIDVPILLTKENIANVSLQLLTTYQKLLHINPENLVLVSTKFDAPKIQKPGYGTWYQSYQQTYKGLPVFGGSVDLIIQNQRLTVMHSDYYHGISVSPIPAISKQQAAETAGRGISSEPLSPISTQLAIFPKQIANDTIQYYTAWKLIMPVLHLPRQQIELHPLNNLHKGNIPVQWCFFVDAATGNILERVNLFIDADLSGNVAGMIYPHNPTDVQQTANISYMNILMNTGGTTYNQETDAVNGHYQFSGLSNGSATIEAHFTGAHVAVHNNETPDPDATHTATVSIPGIHDWNWTTDDPSPNDVETNAFYHVNAIRHWFLRGDPFNVSPAEDPLQVFVRDGVYDNAGYGPGSGLYFSSDSPGFYPDYALCADIIYHEFTHAIVNEWYTGTILPYSGQTGAMNEGWADYFACTFTNDPVEGEGVSINRNIDTPNRHYPEHWGGEVHSDSPIFSGAIWDTRTALGSAYTDDLAFRALKKKSTSFSSYLGAILEEDDNPAYSPSPSANGDPTDGTPNIDAIGDAFYDLHGIYHRNIIGHTVKPIAAILSPDPVQVNYYNPNVVTVIDITGTANRSKANPMANFKVEYANADPPTIWLTAGVTLAGGGTAPITEATLAILNFSGIADGKYLLRLTVTDTAGVQNSVTTKVFVDRLIANGWPQSLSDKYYYPIAVADVDPSVPGLEIVAATAYTVFVYHADGSLFAPWPIDAFDFIKSAPVVADLDNDGRQEIIVSTWRYLQVWRNDGTLVFWTDYGGRGERNYIFPSPVVADLDSDGDMEIIAATSNGKVFIVHHDGTAFTYAGFAWPKTAAGGIYSTPALADLDNDLQKEIVFGCSDGKVYAWKLNGTNAAGSWPVTIGQSTLSSPAIGDIDYDANHDLEIVVGAPDAKVYAWQHDGSQVAGSWPVTIPASADYGIMTSPALVDLDHNGDLEVVINGTFDVMKVLEHDGSYFSSWNPASVSFIVNSPAAGDLDGNDFPEIVAGSYSGKLYAFHPDGTIVSGYSRVTASNFQFGAPLITDLNQDGRPDIVAGSQGLYVWPLSGSYNRSIQNWPTFHHDVRCTGYYGSGSDQAKITVRSGSTNIDHGIGVYDFGSLVADGNGLIVSPDVIFTIDNIGTIDLEVSHVNLISGNTNDFTLTDGTISPVSPAGGTTSFTIRFDPISPGAKSVIVSITTNDINKNPYIFKIAGNGVPMEKIFFPPTYSLPWEGGPFIDGIVDKNPDLAGNPELGWNNAYRLTFANGTNAQTAFQCLRYTYGTDPSIYMSFEVKNDATFDNEDLIILNFRPDKDISNQPQNDFRIFIFPVYTGQGAKDPTAANQTNERNPDIAKPNRPYREVRFYHRELQPDGITWKWARINDVDQAGFEVKVYSFKEGTDSGASYSWNVEVKMPISIKRSGAAWITLQNDFLFFFDVVRVNVSVSNAVQYVWPRNLPEQPYGDLEYNYSFPAIFWGNASLSSSGQCKGVWIDYGAVGVLNDPCQTMNITPGEITSNIQTGQFSASGELMSRAVNRFVATVHNNTEKVVDNGTSATLQPVEAKNMKVRFRVAHWGAALGSGDDWRVIGGLQPADVVDPPFPPKPSVCSTTYSFQTTKDANGWLPFQNVPAATGGPPPTPGESYFFYDWVLSGDETSGDVQYYKDVQAHQCIYVEVDSNSDSDIITRSVFRNMDFVEASAYSDVARISTRGCGEAPNGRNAHEVFLQTRIKTWNLANNMIRTEQPKLKAGKTLSSMGMLTESMTRNPDIFIDKNKPVDSYAEYIVDAYYDTGGFVVINGKRFDLYSPLGSFGYIARHGSAVEEWIADLKSAREIENGIYELDVPPNSHVDIKPFIEAKEPYQFILSLHGGASIPIGRMANTHSTAGNASIDLQYRLFPQIFLSTLFSYNYFHAKSESAEDMYIMTLSESIKYSHIFNDLFSGYAGVGPEIMIVQDEGSKVSLMAELGIDMRINYNLSFELGARYHATIDGDYEFLSTDLGLLIKF